MATYRIGIGSFNLKDGAVGIGTESSGLGNLKVEGTYKTTDLDVTGVSTFTRYAGFAPDNLEVGKDSRDRTLTGEHFTTGDIVVGVNSTFTVSTGATVTVGAVESVSIGTHFSPPIGGIEDRSEVPVEGTVRFNKDLNTLEFYNGFEWRQFTVNGSSGRAFCIGGWTPGNAKLIQYVNIASLGNAIDFGNITQNIEQGGALASSVRGVAAGGGPGDNDHMDYITMASKGDGIDFGNLSQARRFPSGVSSSTRGLFCGGRNPSSVNTIDYIEIATIGNAIDFGDLTGTWRAPSTFGSPTRAVIASQGGDKDLNSVQIASKGNAIDFGNDIYAGQYASGGASSGVRGVWGGGTEAYSPIAFVRSIDISSGGNAVEFGQLLDNSSTTYLTTTGSHTRGLWFGGYTSPANSSTNTIQYITISTAGNAADFGDMSQRRYGNYSCSDSHGGLGGY